MLAGGALFGKPENIENQNDIKDVFPSITLCATIGRPWEITSMAPSLKYLIVVQKNTTAVGFRYI